MNEQEREEAGRKLRERKADYPMENLLEALGQQSDLLSKEELKSELESRGIDVQAFLLKTGKMIDEQMKLHRQEKPSTQMEETK